MNTNTTAVPEKPTGGSIPELRDWQANSLRAIIGHSGLVAGEAIELGKHGQDHRFNNEYGRLGERLYTSFAAHAKATQDERLIELATQYNVLNGAYVLTSILRYGPKAYGAHLQDQSEAEASVQELGDIMARSGGIIKLFADRDQRSNSTFELNFGLWEYPPVYEPVPFIIELGEEDKLVFKPSPASLLQTKLEVARRRLSGDLPMEPNPDERCPAIGRVMTAMWNAGIEESVNDPQLFEAGLAEALAG